MCPGKGQELNLWPARYLIANHASLSARVPAKRATGNENNDNGQPKTTPVPHFILDRLWIRFVLSMSSSNARPPLLHTQDPSSGSGKWAGVKTQQTKITQILLSGPLTCGWLPYPSHLLMKRGYEKGEENQQPKKILQHHQRRRAKAR